MGSDPSGMMLLLDVGNSRVKWAVYDGKKLRTPQAREHRGSPGPLLEHLELPLTDAVWVANVMGPDHEGPIADAIDAQCGARAQFARTRRDWSGLRVAYAEPERLGVDRWLAMAAVWIEEEKPFCVVNAGTALTFDEVRRAGRHAGGLIAPGLTTALNAVRASTRFAHAEPGAFTEGLGTDTEACVRQGALYACAGLVEFAAREVLGAKVLTGGDAETLRPHLGRGWTVRPHLVLEGLVAYANYDRGWRR
jgi:type III pantothenate kinase